MLAQVRTVPVDPFWCLKASEREGTAVLFSIAALQPDLLSGLSVRDDTVSRVLVPLRRPAFLLGSDRYGQVLIVLYDAHAEVWRCRKKGARLFRGGASGRLCVAQDRLFRSTEARHAVLEDFN